MKGKKLRIYMFLLNIRIYFGRGNVGIHRTDQRSMGFDAYNKRGVI